MAEENKDKQEEFINPIDPDKITENPGTLPYAHTVGGAVIKPSKKAVIRGKSMSAMQQQTDMQLDQIKKQIDLLAEQAREIQDRKELSEQIYAAEMNFKPEINHVYHLYEKENGDYVVSMIGPNEWGRGKGFAHFINSIRLLPDHTWGIERH